MVMPETVFIAGGSGYLGSALIPGLIERGHGVRLLTRGHSARRWPAGVETIVGNALDAASFNTAVVGADVYVHLVGVARPSPLKAREFVEIDLASVEIALAAARAAGVNHFVYVSVAQPAPVMRAYVAARARAESLIRTSGIPATILRPWYVLGPGHRWPILLLPLYALLERLPATRADARRLRPVSRAQMIAALIAAIEQPATGVRIVETAEIAAAG